LNTYYTACIEKSQVKFFRTHKKIPTYFYAGTSELRSSPLMSNSDTHRLPHVPKNVSRLHSYRIFLFDIPVVEIAPNLNWIEAIRLLYVLPTFGRFGVERVD